MCVCVCVCVCICVCVVCHKYLFIENKRLFDINKLITCHYRTITLGHRFTFIYYLLWNSTNNNFNIYIYIYMGSIFSIKHIWVNERDASVLIPELKINSNFFFLVVWYLDGMNLKKKKTKKLAPYFSQGLSAPVGAIFCVTNHFKWQAQWWVVCICLNSERKSKMWGGIGKKDELC